MSTSEKRCGASGYRGPVSVAEESQGWLTCSECGKRLKIRASRTPNAEERSFGEREGTPRATLPRHNRLEGTAG